MSDIQINHPVNPAPAEAKTWTTAEMQEEFTPDNFGDRLIFVTRKSDGVKGTLQFNGMPRHYHTWRAA